MKTVVKIELIDQYLKENNIGLSEFCKLSKLSPATIKRMRENRNLRLISLVKLANTLNKEVYEIVNDYPDKVVK